MGSGQVIVGPECHAKRSELCLKSSLELHQSGSGQEDMRIPLGISKAGI